MSDFIKNTCYNLYEDYCNHRITEEELNEILQKKDISKTTFDYRISCLDWLLELPKKIETYGIELEYAGYGTECNSNNELTEDVKYDASVADDGREWNLKPQKLEKLNDENYKRALESWMVTAVNHGCEMDSTAGNHIHFGEQYTIQDIEPEVYEDEYGDEQEYSTYSEAMEDIGRQVVKVFSKWFSIRRGIYWSDDTEVTNWLDMKKVKKELKKDTPSDILKCYEALQFLYSISNRSGQEEYGLGMDGTRGYTRHATVEIRVFRTTTDYRSVIARTKVSKFFLDWCCKTLLATQEYIDWDDVPSIWDELNKIENKEIKNMYVYLAFHEHNRHYMGLSVDELRTKLNITKVKTMAIKRRSSLIAKSLLPNTVENEVKQLFRF